MIENTNISSSEINQTHLLSRLGDICIEELKRAIDLTTLNNKDAIKQSLHKKLTRRTVKIYSEHPAFFLDQEIRPHKMIYVKNKVIPIPLKSARKPTYRDKKRGVAFRTLTSTPTHPGSDGYNFIHAAIDKAVMRLQEEMLQKLFGNET